MRKEHYIPYHKHYADSAFHMASMGLAEADIAESLQVSLDTLQKWKLDHIDFLVLLNKGKNYYRGSKGK